MKVTKQGIDALIKCPWRYDPERQTFSVILSDPRRLEPIKAVLCALPENIVMGSETDRKITFSVGSSSSLLMNLNALLEKVILPADSHARHDEAKFCLAEKGRKSRRLQLFCKFSVPLIDAAVRDGPHALEEKISFCFADEDAARLAGFGLWELAHNRSPRLMSAVDGRLLMDPQPTFTVSRENSGSNITLSSAAEKLNKSTLHNFILRLRDARGVSVAER